MAGERPRRLVIGIGNCERGDDAAGREVARLLCDGIPDDVELIEHDGEATALLAQLEGASVAIIVDACISGAPAGTVHRFDVSAAPLPQVRFGLSTHGLGLAEALELARAMRQLPPRSIVYALEASQFNSGAGLSRPVRMSLRDTADRVIAELDQATWLVILGVLPSE